MLLERATRCMPHYSWSLVLLALVTYEARAAATALLRRIAKNLSRVSCFPLCAAPSDRVTQRAAFMARKHLVESLFFVLFLHSTAAGAKNVVVMSSGR